MRLGMVATRTSEKPPHNLSLAHWVKMSPESDWVGGGQGHGMSAERALEEVQQVIGKSELIPAEGPNSGPIKTLSNMLLLF